MVTLMAHFVFVCTSAVDVLWLKGKSYLNTV